MLENLAKAIFPVSRTAEQIELASREIAQRVRRPGKHEARDRRQKKSEFKRIQAHD
jgi:hypothetical protein